MLIFFLSGNGSNGLSHGVQFRTAAKGMCSHAIIIFIFIRVCTESGILEKVLKFTN